MRVCPDCGKEVCDNHWSHGLCTVCYRKSVVSSGYTKYKESEGDGGKALGIGMMVAGTVETARHKYRLSVEKEERQMSDEAYKTRYLDAAAYVVFIIIFLPTIAIYVDISTHQFGGAKSGDNIFLILGSISAIVASIYTGKWVKKKYYK
jgi:hypothetical protein